SARTTRKCNRSGAVHVMSECRYAYTDPPQTGIGYFTEARLATTTERHKLDLCLPRLQHTADALRDALNAGVQGIVVGMCRGWPGLPNLRLAREAISRGRKVWFYWPGEEAIECIDREQLHRYWVLWVLLTPVHSLLSPIIDFLMFWLGKIFSRGSEAKLVNPHDEEGITSGVGIEEISKVAMPVPFRLPERPVDNGITGICLWSFDERKQVSPRIS